MTTRRIVARNVRPGDIMRNDDTGQAVTITGWSRNRLTGMVTLHYKGVSVTVAPDIRITLYT